MRIAHALELPVKIDITGDPQKDAEIVLYALAGCVGLLVICILLLVIIAVRRSRKRKKKAALVLAQQQAQQAALEKQQAEESAAEHSTYQPKTETSPVTPPVAEVLPEKTETLQPEAALPQPEPIMPEPKEEIHTHTAHIHMEEDPEKKMEEIRRRIAEIAEKRKTESREYQEITLPKLGIDYGQQQDSAQEKEEVREFVQANKWEIEKVSPELPAEDIQADEEPEYAPEDHDLQVPELEYTESGHSDMWIQPDAGTLPQQPEPQPEEPVHAEEHIHTLSEDVAAEHHLPPAAEIHAQPAAGEDSATEEAEPEPEPVVLQVNKDLDAYFQNSRLPLKRLTFAEWVDQFKK